MWIYGNDNRVLILDMDGTIADTYNYPGWVDILRGIKYGGNTAKEIERMFMTVNPLINPKKLQTFCNQWNDVLVWSMIPVDATNDTTISTVRAKKLWIAKHYPFLRNIVITKHKNEKNHIDPLEVKYIHFETIPIYWQPGDNDTLVDDNMILLKNFVGKAMLPPWVNITNNK